MANTQNIETRYRRDEEFKYCVDLYVENEHGIDKVHLGHYNYNGACTIAAAMRKAKDEFQWFVEDENGELEETNIF